MARNFKTIYLTIAVQVADTADCQEVVEDLDYSIKHPKIIDSEIDSIMDKSMRENNEKRPNHCY